MSRNNIWGFSVGVALIGLGLIFMLDQFLRIDIMHYLWPFFILAIGAAFFLGMVSGGRSLGALAVPGSVITMIGLLLFFQNLFGLWATWSYAWTLIICAAGIGLMIFGRWSELPDLSRAGRVVIGIGLALFFIFGMFFELGASLLGMHSPGGVFWALALILVGLYVLFGRSFFNQVNGPVSRSSIHFSPASVGPAVVSAPVFGGLEDSSTPGVPNVVSESSLTGIKRVDFHAIGDMTVLQGDREGLEIEAPDAVKERIRADVHGDTLVIRIEQDWLDWLNPRYWNLSPVRYTLYIRDLESLRSGGLGNLIIPRLSSRRMELVHSGAGNITLSGLVADELIVHQGGLGNVAVEGRTDIQQVDLTALGSYQSRRLECRTAAIRLSGLGSATVLVRETLDAHVSGMGSIEYYGEPRVTSQISGMGSVRRVG